MNVLGVIDLLRGRAVHARAGARDRYAPVTTAGSAPIDPGDAIALANAYVDRFGLRELYVADLDAIQRSPHDAGRSPNAPAVAALAALGVPLWLDAGVSTVADAGRALAAGPSQIVVGLETLSSFAALEEICATAGGDRVAFSLDLREGEPILLAGGGVLREPAARIAARAAAAGVRRVIVIDLARVGTARPIDVELICGIRAAVPDALLLAGGGIRGLDDIRRLAGAGCDGALVATSLHDGRLGRADVAAAHAIERGPQGSGRR